MAGIVVVLVERGFQEGTHGEVGLHRAQDEKGLDAGDAWRLAQAVIQELRKMIADRDT